MWLLVYAYIYIKDLAKLAFIMPKGLSILSKTLSILNNRPEKATFVYIIQYFFN